MKRILVILCVFSFFTMSFAQLRIKTEFDFSETKYQKDYTEEKLQTVYHEFWDAAKLRLKTAFDEMFIKAADGYMLMCPEDETPDFTLNISVCVLDLDGEVELAVRLDPGKNERGFAWEGYSELYKCNGKKDVSQYPKITSSAFEKLGKKVSRDILTFLIDVIPMGTEDLGPEFTSDETRIIGLELITDVVEDITKRNSYYEESVKRMNSKIRRIGLLLGATVVLQESYVARTLGVSFSGKAYRESKNDKQE